MIHFIDLGEQILEGERKFAFYNTVSDMFLNYNGNQVWNKWVDFQTDVIWHLSVEQGQDIFKRLEPLIPEWVKETI